MFRVLMYVVCFFVVAVVTMSSGCLFAQDSTKNYRAFEKRGLEAHRKRTDFADPYEQIKPKAPEVLSNTDTSRRKVEVQYQIAPPIVRLQQRYKEINYSITEVEGFRVQVYSGSERESAYKMRSDVADMLRGAHPVYAFYDRPYFKVRAGDFLTKDEADRICKELRQTYPGAFVVPDLVKIKK